MLRRDRWKVALEIDDHVDPSIRIKHLGGLMNAIGTRQMIGARHHHLAAFGFYRRGDLRRVGRDRDAADSGGERPAQHMHDHRLAADCHQRLSRQAGGGHACRNKDEGSIVHG